MKKTKQSKSTRLWLLQSVAILFFVSYGGGNLRAQDTVTGVIVEEGSDSMPIPGVSVIKKGTKVGVISNFDGEYSIPAEPGDVLEFNYLGMKRKSITVTGTTHNITMEADVENLEEVVVVGYGTVKKKELTGAVSSVKSEDIENFVTSDLGNALQGQASGVNVISSAQPGGSSEILIRGITSVSGSNTPLYVIDGIPQADDPRIPPSEIESIDILKDAASAAIYGTRGASGVILITTKRGKAGSLQVKLNGSYGIQKITSGTPLMNTQQQTYFNLVRDRNVTGSTDDVTVLGLSRSPQGFLYDTDLSELVFVDNAAIQDYTINVSGGTQDITYNVSSGFYEAEGVIINSNFKRFNTRINTMYQHKRWKIGATAGMNKEEVERSPGGIITQTIRYYPTQQGLPDNINEPIETLGGDESNRLGWVIDSFDNIDVSNTTRAYANLNVDYELLSGLNLKFRAGINEANDFREKFNGYTPVYNSQTGELLSNPSNSFVENIASYWSSSTYDGIITYNKKLEDNNITFTAAGSRESYGYKQFTAKKYGVVSNDVQVLNNATLNPDARSGSNYKNKLIGILGRVQYDYKGKYLLSSSVRRDGSSKFGQDYRWGTFPSVSVGWNVSDENFWSSLKPVANNFKIRASRGTVGNQSFSPYSFSAGITQGVDYAFGPEGGDVLSFGSTQTEFANAVVKWETSIQNNVGIDLGFFDNRLTLTTEYYQTKKQDMLFPIVLPGSTGGGNNAQVVLNVGNMTNSGFEFAMGFNDRIGKLNWGLNGTFTTMDNEITKINGEGGFLFTNDYGLISGATTSSQVTVLAEGHEAGAFFLYPTNGIIDTAEKLTEYQNLVPNAQMGDLIYVDSDGSGDISDADRVYSGSGLPEYEVGLNLNADFKGFDFSMQWYGAFGHEIMNGAKATAYGYGRHRDLVYAWSEANPSTTIPAYRGDTKSHPNFKGFTDLWLEKGDYVRLKALTLGYSVPKSICDKIGTSKLRFYFTAQNPLTFTDYSGYDPEIGGGISARGLDKGNYPVTSQYIFGLNFNF
ncbi:SusC/RagA family TonB-linked outer membrane protein [Zobellia roscoffensis]|uniref:SusC/RagA family TonB-linked outer membrane protein n=1 Tax=Zobellia roscoffensis TaxID=2779508 RepID=UPI00188C9C25|nr:TonB-dependent receptor [Zobellia roscoffensis]